MDAHPINCSHPLDTNPINCSYPMDTHPINCSYPMDTHPLNCSYPIPIQLPVPIQQTPIQQTSSNKNILWKPNQRTCNRPRTDCKQQFFNSFTFWTISWKLIPCVTGRREEMQRPTAQAARQFCQDFRDSFNSPHYSAHRTHKEKCKENFLTADTLWPDLYYIVQKIVAY